ncbi:hypothetical protein AVO45_17285 [Ruegeria marisrubri]|uniref:HTH lysR-type domain-containing protein n=1 Tax=Ruegeria marisrubri TaxID=1685379 RepID=A0A0X3UEI0_9RHOB|nr:LysR family transcriptional regulator [Ruegeria marisrubri]KUJ85256.1 hypothetical protein AVO45_17285 [Ruegeria marisrubri]
MRLNGFDLNQLICLEALLRDQNVSRVADRLCLSQSAVSWNLAQLREYFDDPLLVRSGRNFVLTPFAKTLINPVTEIIGQAHALTAKSPQGISETTERKLKIVTSHYAATVGLAEAVRQFGEIMPNVSFELFPITSNSNRLLALGEIDLLLAGHAYNVGVPPNETLFEDGIACLACAENGPAGDTITREEYLSRKHIVIRYFESSLALDDEDVLRREGFMRDRHVTIWSHSVLPQLLIGTQLIATISERVADTMTKTEPLKKLPFPFDYENHKYNAYWHKSRNGDVVLTRFLDLFREICARPAIKGRA